MSENTILKVRDLHATINDKSILKGVNLQVKRGETHAIMGVNGSGKSTLSKVLTGHPNYSVTEGQIIFKDEEITDLEPEQRALKGMFLAFQYPVEVAGVSNEEFLRVAYNCHQKEKRKEEKTPLEFYQVLQTPLAKTNLSNEFLRRNVNEGFSGGEKKRNEIFQLLTLDSDLAILDETDSGLDIDALREVSNAVNYFREKNKSVILITHYQRLLSYIKPDYVHVMFDGKIVKTGDYTLAQELEQNGYEWLTV